jgi:hypothetical protein
METICCCYKHKLQEKKIHAVETATARSMGWSKGKIRHTCTHPPAMMRKTQVVAVWCQKQELGQM